MKRILTTLLLVFMAVSAFAQEGSKRVNLACGPFVQNVTTTGFTVVWTSDVEAIGWVEVAPLNDQHFYYAERPKFFDMSGCGIKPVNKIHKVEVTGLEPGSTYRYRVMMKAVDHHYGTLDIQYGKEYGANTYTAVLPAVTTQKESYKEVKFAMVNDIHEKDSVLRKLFADEKRNHTFDFVFFNGDMTSTLSREEKIVNFVLKPASETFASYCPLYVTRGNHEYRGKDAIKLLDYYAFPEGKPYYTFKYGDVFFLVIDSGEDKPDSDIEYQDAYCTDPYLLKEAEWVKGVVAGQDWKNASKRIVFNHIPPETKNAWHGSYNMNTMFLPILNEAGVDVMLCGHYHQFIQRKKGEHNAAFPVIINSSEQRMEVTVTGNKISIEVFDPEGKKVHTLSL
ncbi:MAG: metallophosphoesterase [Bacteroidales bacterium]|nr:metallophosphoesterase [Bacteroidales bacterium]